MNDYLVSITQDYTGYFWIQFSTNLNFYLIPQIEYFENAFDNGEQAEQFVKDFIT